MSTGVVVLWLQLCLWHLVAALVHHSHPSHITPGSDSSSQVAFQRHAVQDPFDTPDDNQCFPWTLLSSIARDDFEYPNVTDASRQTAKKGDMIAFMCDGIICPNPLIPDCYMDRTVCQADEWCMLEDQVRFGPWASVLPAGETPNLGRRDCKFFKDNGYDYFFDRVCQGHTNWGPWVAIRGRCQKYRKEQQSCNAVWGRGVMGGDLGPQFVVDTKYGRPPSRPLVCAPGLVCTGDLEPTPYTCVKLRPPNLCYQGSWWDSSSWCKVGSAAKNSFKCGLPRRELENIAQALVIQLPVDKYDYPDNPWFWESEDAQKSRDIIQNILQTLWPVPYRNKTTFPLAFPDPRVQGPTYSSGWNTTASEAKKLFRQGNKVWSVAHSCIHNLPNPMSHKEITASRALAVWLRHHFMCCNCRGFFSVEVLNVVGLPPETSDREEHVKWWWCAHNMVSEHTAATRGGHPWVYPAQTDEEVAATWGVQYSSKIHCQNPWFLPFEYVHQQWRIDDDIASMD